MCDAKHIGLVSHAGDDEIRLTTRSTLHPTAVSTSEVTEHLRSGVKSTKSRSAVG